MYVLVSVVMVHYYTQRKAKFLLKLKLMADSAVFRCVKVPESRSVYTERLYTSSKKGLRVDLVKNKLDH